MLAPRLLVAIPATEAPPEKKTRTLAAADYPAVIKKLTMVVSHAKAGAKLDGGAKLYVQFIESADLSATVRAGDDAHADIDAAASPKASTSGGDGGADGPTSPSDASAVPPPPSSVEGSGSGAGSGSAADASVNGGDGDGGAAAASAPGVDDGHGGTVAGADGPATTADGVDGSEGVAGSGSGYGSASGSGSGDAGGSKDGSSSSAADVAVHTPVSSSSVAAGGQVVLSDLVFASFQSIVKPFDTKCVQERLPALAQIFSAARLKTGAEWTAFAAEHRPFLKLCVAVWLQWRAV